jgi:hypothetical protein
LLVPLVLLALLGCCLPPGASAVAVGHHRRHHHHRRHLPRPLYWGAWLGKQFTGTAAPWDMNPVAGFEQIVGKGMSIIEFSSSFEDCSRSPCRPFPFPLAAMDNVRAHGSIPLFSWGSESSPRSSAQQPAFRLSELIEGRYDEYIARFATEAREWGHPFFLRFDWEMNGSWFPWYEGVNGNAPGQYVAAWRHVHDVFASVGATNATWVWCPYADTPKRLRGQHLRSLYPGDAYVDWTCLDGYNWGSNPVNPRPWRSFSEIFGPAYTLVTKKIAPRKPLMLGEFATSPYGGHKARWLRRMFELLPKEFPRVRALVYFDTVDRGIDWPIESSATATGMFARGIHRRIYLDNRFGELATSPIPPPR